MINLKDQLQREYKFHNFCAVVAPCVAFVANTIGCTMAFMSFITLFIVGELNSALGTEMKVNGKIIEQYKEMKDKIQELITAKKGESVLSACLLSYRFVY